MTRHHLMNPVGLAPPTGFSYAALPAGGRTLYLAGITGHHADGSIAENIVDQFSSACATVRAVIEDAGGEPEDLVSVTIYTTDIGQYRDHLKPIGESWRAAFGRHFPPMALIGISELFDPAAMVELVCIAVVEDGYGGST